MKRFAINGNLFSTDDEYDDGGDDGRGFNDFGHIAVRSKDDENNSGRDDDGSMSVTSSEDSHFYVAFRRRCKQQSNNDRGKVTTTTTTTRMAMPIAPAASSSGNDETLADVSSTTRSSSLSNATFSLKPKRAKRDRVRRTSKGKSRPDHGDAGDNDNNADNVNDIGVKRSRKKKARRQQQQQQSQPRKCLAANRHLGRALDIQNGRDMVRAACNNRSNFDNVELMEWSEAVLLQLCYISEPLDFTELDWPAVKQILRYQWRSEVTRPLQEHVGSKETLSNIIIRNHARKLRSGLLSSTSDMFTPEMKDQLAINYRLLSEYAAENRRREHSGVVTSLRSKMH